MSTVAHQVGERYLALVNARDLDGLVALFAPDAVVAHPVGTFEGQPAIRGFYEEHILPHAPAVTATSWVDQGATSVFEMEARAGTGVGHAVDHLTVDGDGRVARLAIYYR